MQEIDWQLADLCQRMVATDRVEELAKVAQAANSAAFRNGQDVQRCRHDLRQLEIRASENVALGEVLREGMRTTMETLGKIPALCTQSMDEVVTYSEEKEQKIRALVGAVEGRVQGLDLQAYGPGPTHLSDSASEGYSEQAEAVTEEIEVIQHQEPERPGLMMPPQGSRGSSPERAQEER